MGCDEICMKYRQHKCASKIIMVLISLHPYINNRTRNRNPNPILQIPVPVLENLPQFGSFSKLPGTGHFLIVLTLPNWVDLQYYSPILPMGHNCLIRHYKLMILLYVSFHSTSWKGRIDRIGASSNDLTIFLFVAWEFVTICSSDWCACDQDNHVHNSHRLMALALQTN
jgi:hypothetical protein